MSDSSESGSDREIPGDRLEALVAQALRTDAPDAAASPAESAFLRQVRIVRDSIALDAGELPTGPPATAVARAKSLASLLPRPAATGMRAWWDRTVATIAACMHDDLDAAALAGLRRSGAMRQASFAAERSGLVVLVDLEIEARGGIAGAAIRGQVAVPDGPAAIAVAVVREGEAAATVPVDRDGFFELEAGAGRWDLAVHLGEAGVVIVPDLEVP